MAWRWMCGLFVITLASFLAVEASAQGQKQPVKILKTWKGSVADANLAKKAPQVITSAAELKKLWQTWQIKDKMPDFDFAKEFLVTATTSGSLLNLNPTVDANGNVELLTLGTADFGPGFRYVIAALSRDGVKTVNGQPLAK